MTDDVLDLDAVAPPLHPHARGLRVRSVNISLRVPAALAAWIREQAYLERTTMNGWIVNLVRAKRDDQLPADVRDWLVTQAAQCGCPGEPDRALVLVLRHLADHWPHGGRLR
jgi:hypothetical protein